MTWLGQFACTVCDSAGGQAVRAGVLDGDFGRNLLAVVLPIAVSVGLVAAVHFGWPARRERED